MTADFRLEDDGAWAGLFPYFDKSIDYIKTKNLLKMYFLEEKKEETSNLTLHMNECHRLLFGFSSDLRFANNYRQVDVLHGTRQ